MRVLITGAGGLVGSALALEYRDDEVFALRHRDLDITSPASVRETMDGLRPDLIFNCAVVGVDDCESDPSLAERVNVTGPALLAWAAARIGAAIVHFSSNYVFDGKRTDGIAYSSGDEARPVNVYGVTKLQGEHAVASASSRAFIVRTSWVFGQGKASFLSTAAAKLARGARVAAISDTFASSTYVADLVTRMRTIVSLDQPATYQLVNDGVCSYLDFAQEAARLTRAPQDLIDVVTESSLGRLAPRPRWTPMQCEASAKLGLPPMRTWQDALQAFLSASPAESGVGSLGP